MLYSLAFPALPNAAPVDVVEEWKKAQADALACRVQVGYEQVVRHRVEAARAAVESFPADEVRERFFPAGEPLVRETAE